ncbi:hypothetical protein [Aureimonas sp. AU40]|uniref:hypothetical protein n=1 Tax=Aureimonas sp. AU40 TaxID=1637747 RepID=UPI00078133B6|nr:hypothetical protein [Aureimonas sp. AU40]
MTPTLPAHVPDNCPGTVYQIYWQRGSVVVGIMCDRYDHLEIVRPVAGMTAEDAEIHAVQVAAAGFITGLVQHRIEWGDEVSDDDLTDAIAAATARGDLDVADLFDAATERGLEPVYPAPAVPFAGYRH